MFSDKSMRRLGWSLVTELAAEPLGVAAEIEDAADEDEVGFVGVVDGGVEFGD